MKRVLYISYDGMTDPLGQSQVIPYLQGLVQKGHSVTLLSAEKPEKYAKLGDFIAGLMKGAGIEWVPLEYHKKPPVLSTFQDIGRMKKKAKELHLKQPFDIAHCRSYIGSMVGIWLKNKFGLKYIFDMRGFWADERVEGGIWNLSNPLYKLIYNYFKRKEKTFFEQADHVVSLTEAGKKVIHQMPLKGQPIPVTVIPCCADLELFNKQHVKPEDRQQVKAELGLQEGQMLMTYLGSIGTWYMLNEMLDFFKVLLQKYPNAIFLFLTGEPEEMVRSKAEERGIPQEQIILRFAQRAEVPVYLSVSSFSIFFIKPLFSKCASSPTKQGEIMGVGKPIVCNAGVGDTEAIVLDSNAGAVVQSFDTKAYQEVVDQLEDCLQLDADRIRQGACKYYDLQQGVERYHNIYNQL